MSQLQKLLQTYFGAMRHDDSPASVAVTKRLTDDGICEFDLTLKGTCLRPVRFDSRKWTEQERHFHSFVGEVFPNTRNISGAPCFTGSAIAAP